MQMQFYFEWSSTEQRMYPATSQRSVCVEGVMYPHSSSCSSIYQHCINGVIHNIRCPATLVFNPINYMCDESINVPGCQENQLPVPYALDVG